MAHESETVSSDESECLPPPVVVIPHQPTSMLNRQTSVGSASDDIFCNECSDFSFRIIATAVCCYHTSWRAKISILWIWVILIAVTVGCVVRFQVFKRYTVYTSPTDTRIVTLPGAALMCQTMSLKSDYHFRVVTFKEYPRINPLPSSVTRNRIVSWGDIPRNGYVYWGFYLLDGTTVRVTSCGESMITEYFIKSKDNLDRMINGCIGYSCYKSFSYILSCPGKTSVQYTIHDSDDYYFYYSHPNGEQSFATVEFQLNRTNFEYYREVKVYACSADIKCSISMPVDPSYVLVHQAPEVSDFNTAIDVECKPRISMYTFPLGLGLFIIATCLSGLIWCKCKDSTQTENQQAEAQHQGERLHGDGRWNPRLPPFHVVAPPRYEELVNEQPDTPPPAYNPDDYI